jgi:SAM-dependent methyltransferase
MNENKRGYSREDWQGHYDSDDLRWDLGEVSPPLKQIWAEQKIAAGRVMIPGCGQGHEAVYLADQGFDVTAVDYAEGAILRLNRLLDERGIHGRVLQEDFFELDSEHDGTYDLIVEQAFFCAIHPSDRVRYVQTAARILKPGGLITGLFYQTDEEGGPPFNTTEQDIRNHFSQDFSIEYLGKTAQSVESRRDKEWLGLLRKK